MSAYDAVHRLIEQDSNWASVAVEYATNLNAGFFGESFQDIIYQQGYETRVSVYDALGFGLIHTMICSKKIVVLEIPLPRVANPNSAVAENRAMLAELPHPFRAEYFGSAADADGHVRWEKKITVPTSEDSVVEILPFQIPLEVGTTNVWTTWGHLRYHGGVARVPYRSRSLSLLFSLDLT